MPADNRTCSKLNIRRGTRPRIVLPGDAMRDKKTTIVRLKLDQATDAWLKRLARVTGDRPAAIVLSMLRHIRIDDQVAHGEIPTSNTIH